MAESILTASSIKLFGRVVFGLKLDFAAANATYFSFGSNAFLLQQLRGQNLTTTGTTTAGSTSVPVALDPAVGNALNAMTNVASLTVRDPSGTTVIAANTTCTVAVVGGVTTLTLSQNPASAANNAQLVIVLGPPLLARIYAFSFEGAIYSLPKPTIFLVHTSGVPIDLASVASKTRSSLDDSGVIAREWEFSAEKNDLCYWEYEKNDYTLRLDIETGPWDRILLEATLRAGADMADRSGASLGVRSGASLAGASLSGASVSGASLSGASLSGASLSGASLRGR